MKKLIILVLGTVFALKAELSPEAQAYQKTRTVTLTAGDKVKAALMGPVPCALAGLAISIPLTYMAVKSGLVTSSIFFGYMAASTNFGLTVAIPSAWYSINIEIKENRKKDKLKHEINTHNFKQECNSIDLTLLAQRKQELDNAINTQSRFNKFAAYVRNSDHPELTLKEKASYTQQAFDKRAIENILKQK